MTCSLEKTIVMVGMMGAGKTAIGKALANRLGVKFVDSDAEIESAATMSIAEIFARDGEAFFRERESAVIARLLEGPPMVLSTGGGAFLREENRKMVAERGVSVWLDAGLDLLWNRVRHKTTRPLLRTANPKETLRELYEARVPIYAQAEIRVEALDHYSIEAMTTAVLRALHARPDILKESNP
ncbi:shikimate kinase [Poseidonocella pacifica]|uniref:Shikimate kinase n=1 Tax=Poseidonocella pacifica TaxID=871651 RepID=A0A1I0VJ10_9RHOB|nr:shikimate kinase [Poseidonocella pacifica]SFA76374.1 shikimate kinase [Poseidonocella pacifica]